MSEPRVGDYEVEDVILQHELLSCTPFCVGDLVRTVDSHFYGRVIWVTQITKRIIDIEYNIRVECEGGGSTTHIKRMFRQPGPTFWYRHKQLEPVTEEEYKQLVLQYELSS